MFRNTYLWNEFDQIEPRNAWHRRCLQEKGKVAEALCLEQSKGEQMRVCLSLRARTSRQQPVRESPPDLVGEFRGELWACKVSPHIRMADLIQRGTAQALLVLALLLESAYPCKYHIFIGSYAPGNKKVSSWLELCFWFDAMAFVLLGAQWVKHLGIWAYVLSVTTQNTLGAPSHFSLTTATTTHTGTWIINFSFKLFSDSPGAVDIPTPAWIAVLDFCRVDFFIPIWASFHSWPLLGSPLSCGLSCSWPGGPYPTVLLPFLWSSPFPIPEFTSQLVIFIVLVTTVITCCSVLFVSLLCPWGHELCVSVTLHPQCPALPAPTIGGE